MKEKVKAIQDHFFCFTGLRCPIKTGNFQIVKTWSSTQDSEQPLDIWFKTNFIQSCVAHLAVGMLSNKTVKWIWFQFHEWTWETVRNVFQTLQQSIKHSMISLFCFVLNSVLSISRKFPIVPTQRKCKWMLSCGLTSQKLEPDDGLRGRSEWRRSEKTHFASAGSSLNRWEIMKGWNYRPKHIHHTMLTVIRTKDTIPIFIVGSKSSANGSKNSPEPQPGPVDVRLKTSSWATSVKHRACEERAHVIQSQECCRCEREENSTHSH